MDNHTKKVDKKRKELKYAETLLKKRLCEVCENIMAKHVFNRKFKKCLMYVIYNYYKDYFIQQDIADAIMVNRTDVVIACADVQRWIKVNEDEVIIGYVKQIKDELDL